LINPIYEVDTVSATAKCPKIEPTFIANTVWKQANQGLGIPERSEHTKNGIYVRSLLCPFFLVTRPAKGAA
jgi:hypothetical protein